MSKSGSSIATGSKLVCPGIIGSFYEGLDPGLSICSNCFEKRKAHKLPSVTHQKKLWLVTEGEAVLNQFLDPIPADMLRPVQRTSPPNPGTTASIQRPLPHWKKWFECLDSAGQPVGMYVNGRVSQPEKPELPLPLGWIAELDSMFRTFYVNVASGTSHWEIPLPLYWKERRNPDGVLFFCRCVAFATPPPHPVFLNLTSCLKGVSRSARGCTKCSPSHICILSLWTSPQKLLRQVCVLSFSCLVRTASRRIWLWYRDLTFTLGHLQMPLAIGCVTDASQGSTLSPIQPVACCTALPAHPHSPSATPVVKISSLNCCTTATVAQCYRASDVNLAVFFAIAYNRCTFVELMGGNALSVLK